MGGKKKKFNLSSVFSLNKYKNKKQPGKKTTFFMKYQRLKLNVKNHIELKYNMQAFMAINLLFLIRIICLK